MNTSVCNANGTRPAPMSGKGNCRGRRLGWGISRDRSGATILGIPEAAACARPSTRGRRRLPRGVAGCPRRWGCGGNRLRVPTRGKAFPLHWQRCIRADVTDLIKSQRFALTFNHIKITSFECMNKLCSLDLQSASPLTHRTDERKSPSNGFPESGS